MYLNLIQSLSIKKKMETDCFSETSRYLRSYNTAVEHKRKPSWLFPPILWQTFLYFDGTQHPLRSKKKKKLDTAVNKNP